MRDFTKNAFSFSWAMSLFGARQLASMLDPRETLSGAPGASKAFDQVTDSVVRQFGANLRQTFDVGNDVQEQIVDAIFGVLSLGGAVTAPVPDAAAVPGACRPPIFLATSRAGEELMITYTRGTGRFSENKQYIALHNQIYDLDGRPNGLHQGVWEALFSTPEELLAVPPPPKGPMDEAVGPVPSVPVSANTIAKWTHADGSSISSVGPAASHLIPLKDGSFLFLVITAQIITEGTGRFAGVNGLTQSLGATHVAAGTNLFSPDGPPTFPATTLDTFKFIRPAGAGGGPGGGGRARAVGGSGSSTGGGAGGASARAASSGASVSAASPPADWTSSCQVLADPSTSKYVDVLGSRMHYVDSGEGSGPPILMLHGNPTWSYLWRNVIPHVAPTARCIAPDLIGMGLSAKPDISYSFFDHVRYVDAFVEALDLEDYALLMHDQGCLIGFYHAMKHEKRVRGLAFLEAMLRPYATWSAFPQSLQKSFKMFRSPKLGPELIIEKNVFLTEVLPAGTVVPLPPEVQACYEGPFEDPESREVILAFVRSLPVAGRPADVAKATGQYAKWLRRTKLPKLFLWADPGLITSERDVDWARRNYKNLETSFLGEGLHFLQESHPTVLGQEVARWLEAIG